MELNVLTEGQLRTFLFCSVEQEVQVLVLVLQVDLKLVFFVGSGVSHLLLTF